MLLIHMSLLKDNAMTNLKTCHNYVVNPYEFLVNDNFIWLNSKLKLQSFCIIVSVSYLGHIYAVCTFRQKRRKKATTSMPLMLTTLLLLLFTQCLATYNSLVTTIILVLWREKADHPNSAFKESQSSMDCKQSRTIKHSTCESQEGGVETAPSGKMDVAHPPNSMFYTDGYANQACNYSSVSGVSWFANSSNTPHGHHTMIVVHE
jgi:hypothetical protein